jgi:hypothetical protein
MFTHAHIYQRVIFLNPNCRYPTQTRPLLYLDENEPPSEQKMHTEKKRMRAARGGGERKKKERKELDQKYSTIPVTIGGMESPGPLRGTLNTEK